MKHYISPLLILLAVSVFAQKKATPDRRITEFDAYAAAGMKTWSIPGMALTLVKDGKVIFTKAYGVRKTSEPELVDVHTQFSIGSTTKAITAVGMAILVDEGKVRWEDPVVNHLPGLQLQDPWVTRNLRIRDLFTHNSGIGNTDFLWANMNISSEAIVEKMAMVEPAYPFRGGFVYQNIFYLIAGQVIERVTGQPWGTFMHERIFKPLGLEHTVAFLKDGNRANEAHPHHFVNGTLTTLKHSSADQVGPAGSVRSCITDMAEWTRCMLDSTRYPGGRLLKPATWGELFAPQVIVPRNQFYPTMRIIQPSWTTYGLGWFQHDYKGRKINYHTGSLPGEIAMAAQLPSENLGFFFLGNMDHAELRHALVYKAFDLFALGGTRDWNTEFKKLYDELGQQQNSAVAAVFAARVNDTRTSHPLAAFAGTYVHPLHGTLTITTNGNELQLDLNGTLQARLEHFHYDTFVSRYSEEWMGKGLISFNTGPQGNIATAESGGVSFRRVR